MVLGGLALPLAVLHLELGALGYLALLWARVSDIAILNHGAPAVALPIGLGLILASLGRKLLAGERIELSTFRDLYPAIPYTLVVLLSWLWSAVPERALYAGIGLLKDLLVFWVLADVLRHPWSLRRACYVMVLTAGGLSLISLHQYFTGRFDSDYGGFARSEVLNIFGEYDSHRLGGPLNDPNIFPVIVAVALPLGLALLRCRLNPLGRVAVLALVPAILLTVLLSFSRGAILVTGFMLLLSLRRHRIGLLQVALAGAVLAVVLAIAPPTVWSRMSTLAQPLTGPNEVRRVIDVATELRVGAQRTAFEMFLTHPLLGVGAENYEPLYPEYARLLGVRAFSQRFFPHNTYLQVMAETGLAGLLTYGFLIAVMLRRLWRARRAETGADPESHDRRELQFGVEAAFLGYLVDGFFEGADFPRYFWMLLALVVVAARPRSASPAAPPAGQPARLEPARTT